MEIKIAKAAEALKNCNKLLVGTGAGMGKDSGMPDFRGNEGFWNNYPPFRGKFDFYQCASPQFLRDHPNQFWGFYGIRLKMYRQTKPHYGFNLLSKLSQKMQNFHIITSNVDGHFHKIFTQKSEKQKILQVHGSIHFLQCYFCDQIYDNNFEPKINLENIFSQNLPICPKCNKNIVRPNILMFGDWEWLPNRTDLQYPKYNKFTKGLKQVSDKQNNKLRDKLMIIEIGCGTAVPTIRNMCQRMYYQHKNSILIRINTDQDHQSKHRDNDRFFYIQDTALSALTKLCSTAYSIQ